MYKIGIDARLLGQTGVGVYLDNLLYYLEKKAPGDFKFYIYLLNGYENKINFKSKNFVKRIVNSYWHSFSEQIIFLNELNKDNLDLMHFTYFSYPILYRRKFISTIHDTTPLLFKTGRASTKSALVYGIKHLVFRFVLHLQVKKATAIITPSETVKKELIKRYGAKYSDKIYPIYEGLDYSLVNLKPKKPINISPPTSNIPYFIYVGNFYPHKNIEILIKSFSNIKGDFKLVLIGPKDFFAEKISILIKENNLSEKIIFYHNPTREEMIYFYKNASALIHPSKSEGFGLPLIEAAYFNLPIIASDIPIFNEILDGEYIKFNPDSQTDIALKINNFVKNKKRIDFKKILEKYSFERMTEKTLEIFKQAVELS